MFMGIAEVCLFTVLSPRVLLQREAGLAADHGLPPQSLRHWAYWFVIAAIHTALAVLLVLNRLHMTDQASDFSTDLQPLADRYIGWMHGDVIGASILTLLLGFSAWILLRRKENLLAWSIALTILIPIPAFIVVPIKADSQRRETNDFIFAPSRK
jgi:hypothetical protein